ncbi:MAG: MFS family permease [Candidatus Nanohaloarchaea archaeon]|jgi:MFS family permease
MHITTWMERVDLKQEIQEVYLHTFLFKLGVKLVSIFIPFYILELGFSLNTVFMFFLIYYGSYLVFSWTNALICSKIGYKHTMILASAPIIAFYFLLRGASSITEVYSLALLGGFAFNLYWTGMNPETANSSHDGEREKETGFFFSMPSLASISAPIIGGMILAISSFQVLFGATVGLIALSFLPFLLTQEHYTGMDLNLREFISEFGLTDFMTFFFKGFNSMGKKMLWPAYLAVIIGGSLNIGGAGSFRALGSVITSIGIGRIANDGNRSRIVVTGMIIAAGTYMLMASVTTPTAAFLISLVNGLSYTAASIPIYSRAMAHAEKEDLIEYFALREFALGLGRTAIILATIGIFTVLEGRIRFLLSFSVVAVSVIMAGFFGSKMQK